MQYEIKIWPRVFLYNIGHLKKNTKNILESNKLFVIKIVQQILFIYSAVHLYSYNCHLDLFLTHSE